ncbi:hypothetical protein BN996_00199 [Haloferax massiliensis]|uniref:Uncharacterized protein n=1 Tax=Haloferax massiliensis TaxID=1476858 RepID=A0A0D6JLH5_9EURY|nr:hypothetical protein BN996_00199 [Haloferax massiliensis]
MTPSLGLFFGPDKQLLAAFVQYLKGRKAIIGEESFDIVIFYPLTFVNLDIEPLAGIAGKCLLTALKDGQFRPFNIDLRH